MRRGQKTSAEQVVLKLRQIEVQTACPSSDDLRRFEVLRNGGSGPLGLSG